jgi:magnesium chelatase family protein
MLDRIDIHVEAAALNVEDIQKNTKAESSAEIRARVVKAREIQAQRFSGTKIHCNADMTPQLLRKYCLLSAEQNALLVSAMNELGLSARAWDRILKVSRTIADLEFSDTIETHHLLEAINYSSLDRNF